MDAYEWADFLWDRYCLKQHYLLSSLTEDPRYLTRQMKRGEIVWDASQNDEIFIVTIHFDTESYCIKAFDCVRELADSSCHGRPRNRERKISNIDKSGFYGSFIPHITKDPSLAKQSWDELFERAAEIHAFSKEAAREKQDPSKYAQIVEQLIETQEVLNGKLPEFLIAMKHVAGKAPAVEQKVFAYLRSLEDDTNAWGPVAYFTANAYKVDTATEYKEELHHIRSVALKKDAELNGRNFWQYRLSYNPIQSIIGGLAFLDYDDDDLDDSDKVH